MGVTLPPQRTFPTPSGTPPTLGTGLVCEVFSETEHLYKLSVQQRILSSHVQVRVLL